MGDSGKFDPICEIDIGPLERELGNIGIGISKEDGERRFIAALFDSYLETPRKNGCTDLNKFEDSFSRKLKDYGLPMESNLVSAYRKPISGWKLFRLCLKEMGIDPMDKRLKDVEDIFDLQKEFGIEVENIRIHMDSLWKETFEEYFEKNPHQYGSGEFYFALE